MARTAAVCGDEYRDYAEVRRDSLPVPIAAYGFEDCFRLAESYEIPPELVRRLRHALDLPLSVGRAS